MSDFKMTPFNSIEDAFAYMRQQEDRANANVHRFQRSISRGDYVFRRVDDLLIFGYVFTAEEALEGEDDPGLPNRLDDLFERGYRYGRWYSNVVLEGEIGDTHIANLWPIFKEEFDEAQVLAFDPVMMRGTEWFDSMIRRIIDEMASSGSAMDASGGAQFDEPNDC